MSKINKLELIFYTTVFIILTIFFYPLIYIFSWTLGLIVSTFKKGYKEGKST